MAINTIKATIQMRKGLERDFDADQMTAGEWAVSTDTKYVRMCFAPGIVVRMATYEAFEQDMTEIQTILATCQDIQTAVDAMADLAEQHKNAAEVSAKLSRSWAEGGTGIRTGEDTNNSKYFSQLAQSYAKGTNGQVRPNDNDDSAKGYYEKTRQIAQGANGLIPMGTIAFADLPTSNILQGAMYNISDDFTSDNRFVDGGGKYYGSGSNVYWVESDQKWDVTAASGVSGVKGDKESAYRQGFINLTPEDIGAATKEDIENFNPDFEGTRAAMQEKLDAGELKDGTTVYLTDKKKIGVISDARVYFEEALERENIISGESLRMISGKIERWFNDLTQAANVINGVNQALAGQGVLDAAVGAYLDGKKQDELMLGSNTIKDLDSLFVGCEWYNAEQMTSESLPFSDYGMILSIKATASTLMQLAIPYGASPNIPKWRSRVNNAWQGWKTFEKPTIKMPDNGTDLNDYLIDGIYFKGYFTTDSDENYPFNGVGWLEVYTWTNSSGVTNAFQRYTVWGSTLVYTRCKNENGWTPWKQVGGVVSHELLSVNGSLIGANSVIIEREGKLRTINGYIQITGPVSNNDELIYLTDSDKPRNTQRSSSIRYNGADSGNFTMCVAIDAGGNVAHVNDTLSISPGSYTISFAYHIA